MIQTPKRILALVLVLTATWSLVDSKPSSGYVALIRPSAMSGPPSRPLVPRTETLDLLKEREKSRSISERVRHAYRLDLQAGQFLHLTVQQNGIDVRLAVYGPGPKLLFTVDSANSGKGPEPVFLVAKSSGQYEIIVSTDATSSKGTNYFVDAVEIRRARNQDRRIASAFQSYYKARERLHHEGFSDRVVKSLESTVHSLDEAGSPEYLRADAWADLGKAYAVKGQWLKSVTAYRQAAGLFHRIGRKDKEAFELNEIGRGEEQLVQIPNAVKHYREAANLAHSAKAESTEASALTNLGMYYAERADLEAEKYLQEAIPLWRKLHDQEDEAKALNGVGQIYARLGDNEKALSIYQSELQDLKLTPLRRAVTLTQIGNAYLDAGRPEASFRYFKDAYDSQRLGGDPENEANTLTGFGVAYAFVHRWRDALDAYQRALTIYKSLRDFRNQANVYLDMGWALGGMKRYNEARESFRFALSRARDLRNPVWQAGALLGFAWLERQRGNLNEAQREAEQARDLIEAMRNSTENEELQKSFFSIKQDTYATLLGILIDRYEKQGDPAFLAQALQVSESARARALLDSLMKRGRSASGPRTSVLTAAEIQQHLLGPETALLEYTLGRTQSYLLFVTSSEVSSFRLPAQDQVEALAKAAYESFARSNHPGEKTKVIARSRQLSDMLLKPLAGRLGNRRLIIVASGTLQSIPFGGLPDPDAPGEPGDRQSWPQPLLVRHEVTAEPSASVLAQIRRIRATRQPASHFLATLADSVFSRNDDRLPKIRPHIRDNTDSILGNLPRLPASREEAEAISKDLPKERVFKAFGFDANRKLLTSGKVKDYRILHLATHTFSVPEHPESAAILLSHFDKQGNEIEGQLNAKDISALEIRSDLVVLSSCNSARGKNVPGEGVVGLPQAFLSAGASGVVSTVWDVDDQRASDLMKLFYTNLLTKGMPLSAALRSAQIEMMGDTRWKAPWFWAGFVAQGEGASEFSLNKNQPTVSSLNGGPKRSAMTKRSPPSRVHY